MSATALIAGTGNLPILLAEYLESRGAPFVLAQMEGFECETRPGWQVLSFRVERLGRLFDQLRAADVTRVVFAGAAARPAINPAKVDLKTASLLPRLLPAIKQGDDALLRAVISVFEDAGFAVVGAADVMPDLVPGAGVLGRVTPSEADRKDASRAAEIVQAMGPLDIGQGAVVAQGLCLAVETLPGTDAMLRWVADVAGAKRPNPKGAKGVLFKAAKPGQDRRVDLPAVGPDTIKAAAAAGLAGVVIEAGSVMVLNLPETLATADELGLFLWARSP